MKKELVARIDMISDLKLDSIYFGGGTPSMLQASEINELLDLAMKHGQISTDLEVTLEANPDDLTKEKLKDLKHSGINRLSIGIQSFIDRDLKFMNRSHGAHESYHALENAKKAGFEDISLDLIFGIPNLTDVEWTYNLTEAVSFDPVHISSYNLTIEPKTVFDNWVKKNKMPDINEDISAQQFLMGKSFLEEQGYDHYEISNYGKPEKYAVHNTNYWKNKIYLGIGPSAHSYDGRKRSWNVANNALYMKSIQEGIVHFDQEELTTNDQYNEYIMTSLRTKWGADITRIDLFGEDFKVHFLSLIEESIMEGHIRHEGDKFFLTTKGMLLADQISSNLFRVPLLTAS